MSAPELPRRSYVELDDQALLERAALEHRGICSSCGHPIAEHVDSGWGPNTVCVEPVGEGDHSWHGVCPCVRHDDVDVGVGAREQLRDSLVAAAVEANERIASCHERVECPKCGAPVGARCVRVGSRSAKALLHPHRERWTQVVPAR